MAGAVTIPIDLHKHLPLLSELRGLRTLRIRPFQSLILLRVLRASVVKKPTNMKTFNASIEVMPHDNLLDPQGKAVSGSMKNMNLAEITNVRIGKHITLQVEAKDKKTAEAKVDEACKKLLANLVMEKYSFSVSEG